MRGIAAMETDRSRISDSFGNGLSYCLAANVREARPNQTSIGAVGAEGCRAEEAKIAEFVDVVERCRPQLLRVVSRMTGGRQEEGDDIVQYALMKAFANLRRFPGEAQMTTWLCAIVRNATLEFIRNQHGRVFVPLDCPPSLHRDRPELDIPEERLNPEEVLDHREREELIYAAIGKMSPTNRHIFEMCVLEERPYLQVATVLRLSLSTVKSRLFRCRRHLRKEVEIVGERST
jgi:RNA polymerase sigma-70 factor, ECF subfamily